VRLADPERAAIAAARTIYAFDDTFVAPRNGFADANDYYARCSASGFLPGIGNPTLLLFARDDPWIPAKPYEDARRHLRPNMEMVLSQGGGHVGFHGKGSPVPWHDQTIAAWLDAILQLRQ